MKTPSIVTAIALTVLLPATLTFAQTTQTDPTIKDRIDQAVSTVSGSPMAELDVDMKHVLDALTKLNPQPIDKLSAQEARKQPSPADGVKELLKEQGKDAALELGITIKDVTYPAGEGTQTARIYSPEGANGALPIVVYYHGGGFVIADLDTYDATPRAIVKGADVIVVSVEYRHAPESKFPAQQEDAFAAYKWVLANAKAFHGDEFKVALLGESAGGNLATNVAIMARDANVTKPVYVVAVYPMAGTNLNTGSYIENASAKPLNKPMMAWFYDNTVRGEADRTDPRLDIVGKADLKGLPPFTIVTAQIDPLRDDGRMLAEKLKASGTPVRYREYMGVTHEFFGMGNVVGKAKDAELEVVEDLKSAFKGATVGLTK